MTARPDDRVDPELLWVVDALRETRAGEQTTAEGMLRAMGPVFAKVFAQRPTDKRVATAGETITGPDGDPLRLRVHRPVAADGPAPGLLWIHGGGMVTGNPVMDEGLLLRYAAEGGAVVAAVDYRHAPAHRYPAAVQDAFAALQWLADADGVDATRLVVAGASAGGGISAAVALMARDRGGPPLVLQQIIYPMLDDRMDSPSAREFAGAEWPWSRENNQLGWEALLGDAFGTDDVPAYAAPARALDLSGLPPAYLHVGGLEVARDETVGYATRLAQAGVPVELHVFAGGIHGWDLFDPDADISRRAHDTQLAAFVRATAGRRAST